MKIRTMMMRSILAATLVTTVGLGTQAFAEAGPTEGSEMTRLEKHAQRLDRRMVRMTKKLHLTPSQSSQIRTLLESQGVSVSDAIARAGGDRKAARVEIKGVRKSTKAQIKALLTADQKTTYRSMKRKHLKRKRARRASKALGLSPEQKAEFKVIRKEARAQRAVILEGAGGDRQAARPALKTLRLETREKLSNLLSPAQQATFDKLRAKRIERRKARKARKKG